MGVLVFSRVDVVFKFSFLLSKVVCICHIILAMETSWRNKEIISRYYL